MRTRGSDAAAAASGRLTTNLVPPGRLCTVDRAVVGLDHRRDDGQAEAGAAARGGPGARTRLVSARVKRSKTWSAISGGMPGPLSVTVISACAVAHADPASTWVPGGVWVRALASRLATTWCSRYGSARR